MEATIRAVRRSELGQVYGLLEAAFGQKDAPLVRFAAQTESDSTFRLRHGRVALVGGRVVGYVRIFARTMLFRGVPMPVGGIGSVATHGHQRHGGIATALLEDSIEQMRAAGMAASYLFTGIPGFYERVGFWVVREPQFTADAREAASIPNTGLWNIRLLVDRDVPRLLGIYRRAIAGSTGAIVRTARTWQDATTWLDEDPGGCFVAERNDVPVAYLRSRSRTYGRQVLEAECAPGHEGAIAALVAAVGTRAREHGGPIIALAPEDHPLATALRALPSTSVTSDVEHPMMALALDARGTPLLADHVRWWNTDRI